MSFTFFLPEYEPTVFGVTIDPTNGITFPSLATISPTGLANNIAGFEAAGGTLTIGGRASFVGDDGAILDGVLRTGPFKRSPIILRTLTGTAVNGGDVTLDLTPFGLIEGDWVGIVQAIGCNVDRTGSMTVPTGWTSFGAAVYATVGAEDASVRIIYKQMTATPDTSVLLSGSGVSTDGHAVCAIAIRNFGGFSGGWSGKNNNVSSPITYTATTSYSVTTGDDALSIAFYGAGLNVAPTQPSNPLYEAQDLAYQSGTYDAAAAITVRRLPVAGDYTGTFPDFTNFVDTGGSAAAKFLIRYGSNVS